MEFTEYLKIGLTAPVCALIGWYTNRLAIKLIFRPVNPVRIPVVNLTIQGLVPRRKEEIGARLGEIIDRELVSFTEMLERYVSDESISQIKEGVIKSIMETASAKIPLVFAAMEKAVEKYLRDFFDGEGDRLLRNQITALVEDAPGKVSLSSVVAEKVNGFDMKQLERIIISVAADELRHIEQLGAVLGFLIGLLQVLILLIF